MSAIPSPGQRPKWSPVAHSLWWSPVAHSYVEAFRSGTATSCRGDLEVIESSVTLVDKVQGGTDSAGEKAGNLLQELETDAAQDVL